MKGLLWAIGIVVYLIWLKNEIDADGTAMAKMMLLLMLLLVLFDTIVVFFLLLCILLSIYRCIYNARFQKREIKYQLYGYSYQKNEYLCHFLRHNYRLPMALYGYSQIGMANTA